MFLPEFIKHRVDSMRLVFVPKDIRVANNDMWRRAPSANSIHNRDWFDHARVSTDDQTLDLQRDALKRAKCRQI